jgi:hypothetical protein
VAPLLTKGIAMSATKKIEKRQEPNITVNVMDTARLEIVATVANALYELAKALNHVPSIHIENNSIVKNTEGPAILVITDSHENRKVTL